MVQFSTEIRESTDSARLEPTIEGSLWKRKANLTKTSKMMRVLRKQANVVLESGLRQIHLERIGQLARDIMGMQGCLYRGSIRALEGLYRLPP